MPSIDDADAVWQYNLEYHITTVHPTAKLDLYSNLYEISRGEEVDLKTMSQIKEQPTASKTRNLEVYLRRAHNTVCITGRYLFVAYLNQEINSSTSIWHTIGLLPAKKLWKLRKMKKDQLSPRPFSRRRILKSINGKSCRRGCTKAGRK